MKNDGGFRLREKMGTYIADFDSKKDDIGVSNYEGIYEKRFVRNLACYASIRLRIKRRVEKILENPYHNTEFLGDTTGKLNLIGCRSARSTEISGSFL